eukprot:scaffold3098_cov205-Chaetoceros_neogracile.AAC.1
MKLAIALSLVAGAAAFTTNAPRAFTSVKSVESRINTGLEMAKQVPHGGQLIDLMVKDDAAKEAAIAA